MAGPFAVTSAPMLEACLATKTSYVDITGEIEVFEALWARRAEIERAGITALPGAGFDVVPTDCLAAHVSGELGDALSLIVGISGSQSVSQGTMLTAIRQIAAPVLCRRDGKIVPLDKKSPRLIDFGSGDQECFPVSWGDVATASHSTGAENITVYLRRGKLFTTVEVIGLPFGSLLRSKPGQTGLAAIVRLLPEGPSRSERLRHRSTIWAEATNASGGSCAATLSTPDPYDFTASSALEIVSRITALPAPLGLVTPSQAFGSDFVLGLPGCARTDMPARPPVSP